ncbi:MAG: PhoX family phosphatase [Candidatus Dactylopiibacterium sp.]|nr:PhoX family phosphatase [Candidatus Dactylopiibacterium sp.]
MSKNNFAPFDGGQDPDDIGNNHSPNTTIQEVLNQSRRQLLRGSLGGAGLALFGGFGLAACGGGGSDDSPGDTGGAAPTPPRETLLGFNPVAKSLADAFIVPAGYTASVIYACGDPLAAGVAAARNDGTDTGYDKRSGDCHDGMEYFGLSAAGTRDDASAERALLGINHEYITPVFLHASGPTANPRPAGEADKEIDCHGVAIVEVRRNGGKFGVVQDSLFNRRITPNTEIEFAGVARGNALLKTKFSADGTRTRGTLNNCGTGKTPWGTLLTGEENWSGYFARGAADDAARGSDKSVTSLRRYGRNQGATSRYGWQTAGAADKYARWDISKTGASGDGSDDYRNEMNGQGYLTEIDPYDRNAAISKRTSLGRFAHEGAAFSRPVAGKPLAVYMGDDSQGEYVYKWVSAAAWVSTDATAANRMATGDKYLNAGKLYVAKYKPDGSGEWIELSITHPAIAGYASYAFADQADVVVNARLAADAVGATKMDRPEWCATHPGTGEVYFTMTNNSSRNAATVDAANPRAYTDMKGSTVQNGNVNGHIIRMAEQGNEPGATAFTWDVYLFGAEAEAGAGINLSGLTAINDFSSPDGLAFTPSTGICWIQTDDGAYTDVTNCMMLAAVPGKVGDGSRRTVISGATTLDTYVGREASPTTLKRFLVGPRQQEITGICETPDGRAIFVNVQHPGENTTAADLSDPAKFGSRWPANAGYGAGQRPRSATVVITKDDGGRIGT